MGFQLPHLRRRPPPPAIARVILAYAPGMSFRRRTITGLVWNIGSNFAQQSVRFIVILVLARLLNPDDFGLVGMVTVFSGFAMMFSDLGLNAALIQRPSLTAAHLSSAFWLSLATGVVLALLFAASAPLIAEVFARPELIPLVRVMSLTYVLSAVSVVQKAVLMRAMDFRNLTLIQVTSIGVAAAVGVALAIADQGAWSLVGMAVATPGCEAVLLWSTSRWRPSRRIDRSALTDLWRFGRNLTGFSALNYWARNADNLLIGRYVGATALGFYSRAYQVMLLPISQVTGSIGQVMFPALSRIQEDKVRFKKVYLSAVAAIAFVTFPTMAGIFAVSDSFVAGILGTQWGGSIPILRWLAFVGLIQSVGATTGWIYQAQGRTDRLLRWGVFSSAVTVGAFVAGLPWGALGVAIAYTCSSVGLLYPNIVIAGRLVGLRFGEVAQAVVAPLIMSVTTGALVFLLGALLRDHTPPLGRLVIQTAAGVLIYSLITAVKKPAAFLSLRSLLQDVLAGRRPPVGSHGPDGETPMP